MAQKPDAALKTRIDGYIDRIAAAAAQDPDGYVNTYTQMREPNHRWGQNGGNDREQHDLYNLACLAEAGVRYYLATGENQSYSSTAVRAANGMANVMGPPPKKNIIPGHCWLGEEFFRPGLYELFKQQPPKLKQQTLGVPVNEDEISRAPRGLWIDARGRHRGQAELWRIRPRSSPRLWSRQPIEGHAVRAALLAAGVTAFGSAAEQRPYVDAAERLWTNMVTRRLYITGGVGAIAHDEKFGNDFVLPNDGYLETCAAVANGFFSHNLFLATGDAAKLDELERSLYNGALAGVSLAGNTYIYENPLEAGRDRARWPWHACPCCPPMFLKLMGALPGYVYATSNDAVYVNLFIGSHARVSLNNGKGPQISLAQVTDYPCGWKHPADRQSRTASVSFDLFAYAFLPGAVVVR